jgi:hypothetical protein
MTGKLLLVTEKFGDLGNRLFRYARLLASKPPRVAVVDLSFFQYSWMFHPEPPLYRALFRALSLFGQRTLTLLNRQTNIPVLGGGEAEVPLTCRDLFQTLTTSSSRIHCLDRGSYFATADPLDARGLDTLRRIFRLKPHFHQQARHLLKEKCGFSKLVGVHIRRGDYRVFADGAWFFEDEVYARIMKDLKASYPGPGEVGFLLVSDESLDTSSFDPIAPLTFGKNDPGLDQALLSLCDFILGPESTFSAWPGFLHEIPRAVIANASCRLRWEDFQRTSINYFPGNPKPL